MNTPVYSPKEDTNLLISYLSELDLKGKRVLDMGTGSGVLSKKCLSRDASFVLAIDKNEESVKATKKRLSNYQRAEVKRSSLFEEVNKKDFDLILFNPPYLPSIPQLEEKIDSRWDGGDGGIEVINNFLEKVGDYLADKGSILVVLSSKTDTGKFVNKCRNLGFDLKKLRNKKIFFEELFLFEIK